MHHAGNFRKTLGPNLVTLQYIYTCCAFFSFTQEYILHQLGKMAADTLTTTNIIIVFTEENLELLCEEIVLFHAREMGLLCKKGEKLWQMFHKSANEYFAGVYLSNRPEDLSSYLEGVTSVKEALSEDKIPRRK